MCIYIISINEKDKEKEKKESKERHMGEHADRKPKVKLCNSMIVSKMKEIIKIKITPVIVLPVKGIKFIHPFCQC